MESRNSVLKKALEEKGVSQQKLADELGITRTAINERLNGDKEIESLDFIKAVSKLTGKPLLFFLEGETDLAYLNGIMSEPNNEYLKGSKIRPIIVTVDRSGKELISYVPVKAQAGYMKGYGESKFIEKLPAFTLPQFNEHGSYRMFQVSGDSMLQLGGGGLHDGDIVIGQYLEDIFSLRDNRDAMDWRSVVLEEMLCVPSGPRTWWNRGIKPPIHYRKSIFCLHNGASKKFPKFYRLDYAIQR